MSLNWKKAAVACFWNDTCPPSRHRHRLFTAAAAASDALDSAEKSGQLVLSPVVGVFYESPAQDGAFVQVGSVVKWVPAVHHRGHEAMNEVSSAFDGIVLEIFVENGQRVEYGQPLMRIGGDVSC